MTNLSKAEAERRRKLNKAAVALGRKGGQSTSERKVQASIENGKKGGRPKDKPVENSKP